MCMPGDFLIARRIMKCWRAVVCPCSEHWECLAQRCLWPWMNSTSPHSYVEQPRQNEPPSVFSQARLKDRERGPQI